MIKMLAALSLASCATVAPAQFFVSGSSPNYSGGSPRGAVLPQIESIGGPLGSFDDSITPTMRREQQERTEQTLRFIASAPDKWTSSNPRKAQRLYAKAEREAKWARIRANREDM